MTELDIKYIEIGAMILFGIGFSTLLFHGNMIKKIIGMNIMDTSIFLFFITRGYINNKEAPIIINIANSPDSYVRPLPSALMLTGIVVAISMTAFALALTIKLNQKYGTIDLNKIMEMRVDKQ